MRPGLRPARGPGQALWRAADLRQRLRPGALLPGAAAGTLKVATCNKLLGWYPAFAGRYTSAWGKEYGACKERELHKPGDYYSQRMWPICRPAAMLAHDSAMGHIRWL